MMKKYFTNCIMLIIISTLWSIKTNAQVTNPSNNWSSGAYVGWNSPNNLDFKLGTTPTQYMTILGSNGNVGIGITNPAALLHLDGNNAGTGEVFRTDGPAVSSYWRMYSNATERLRLEWDNTNSVSLFQSVNAPLSIRALTNNHITFLAGCPEWLPFF